MPYTSISLTDFRVLVTIGFGNIFITEATGDFREDERRVYIHIYLKFKMSTFLSARSLTLPKRRHRQCCLFFEFH